MSNYNYPAIIEPISAEDGGGYLVSFPDLPLMNPLIFKGKHSANHIVDKHLTFATI